MCLTYFFLMRSKRVSDLVQITRYSKSDYYELIRELDRQKKQRIFEPQLPLESVTKLRAKSVTAASKETVPDCLACGVCCAFALIVPVRIDDTARLGEYWDVTLDGSEHNIVIERVLPRDVSSGYCSHLAGELADEIACRIYHDRPLVCREFDAGSDRCHEYRRMYGLVPRLNEAEVAEELAKLTTAKRGVISFASIVLDSVSTKTVFSKEDGGIESSKTIYLKIVVFVDEEEETEYEIHTYDASKEMWFESDLLGMTLSEAQEFIISRG